MQPGLSETVEHIVSVDLDLDKASLSELVLKRIKLLSMRRIAWLRKLWAEVTGEARGEFNAHIEVDGYLTERDHPFLEKEWYEQDAEMQEFSYALNEIDRKISELPALRINLLARIFALHRMETDLLQACFALSIEPNLGRVFAYLQDHSARGYVTESLVARLFGYGQCISLSAGSPIKTWGMVRESISLQGEPARLECDPFIRRWLLGNDDLDDSLLGLSEYIPVREKLSNWPVKELTDNIRWILEAHPENKVRVFVEGAEGSGRKSFAAIVSGQFGLPLLAISADRVPENNWPHVYMLAQRQAFLLKAALLWHGKSMAAAYWPASVASVKLQFVTGESHDPLPANNVFLDLRVSIPPVSMDERLTLWQSHVPSAKKWNNKELEEMVLRYESTVGQIVAIGKKMTPTIADAYRALREDSGRSLGRLAQQMPATFTFDDLVLPDYTRRAIEDFIFEATERVPFWEQPQAKRLYPQGRGLIGLFTGDPGTGKTMAAQVIAATLKLDLFRIDLSNVISKYVGETSQNLDLILSRASNMNVVLLFDEADSLFGKRTEIKDAHDRYANTDTNYLLQAIETYPGIVILASNKKSNIDNSFTRRLRYILEFPKPDVSQRLTIWKKIIREMAGEKILKELEGELERLSAMREVTGAQIKQAVLSALFMARREGTGLNISHLLEGLERELAKEGRGLGREVRQNFKHTI